VIAKMSGFDSAPLIPVGSVIADAYWTAPYGYVNPGERYETKDLALEAAIARVTEAVAKHNAFYAGDAHIVPLPEDIRIEYRWRIEYNGGAHDAPIQTTDYPTIEDATIGLELYRLYSPKAATR
jgi:hypothetical protein